MTDRGFINVDIQMRTNVPHIFAIGDIVGQPMLAHKAVQEAQLAAQLIAGELKGLKFKKGLFPWTTSGCAIASGRDEGVNKLLFDDSAQAHGQGKISGGGMVGTHLGDMIGEIALVIKMGTDAVPRPSRPGTMHMSIAPTQPRFHSHHHASRSAAAAAPTTSAVKPKLQNTRRRKRALL